MWLPRTWVPSTAPNSETPNSTLPEITLQSPVQSPPGVRPAAPPTIVPVTGARSEVTSDTTNTPRASLGIAAEALVSTPTRLAWTSVPDGATSASGDVQGPTVTPVDALPEMTFPRISPAGTFP